MSNNIEKSINYELKKRGIALDNTYDTFVSIIHVIPTENIEISTCGIIQIRPDLNKNIALEIVNELVEKHPHQKFHLITGELVERHPNHQNFHLVAEGFRIYNQEHVFSAKFTIAAIEDHSLCDLLGIVAVTIVGSISTAFIVWLLLSLSAEHYRCIFAYDENSEQIIAFIAERVKIELMYMKILQNDYHNSTDYTTVRETYSISKIYYFVTYHMNRIMIDAILQLGQYVNCL